MKLFRIVHKSLIEELWHRPQAGAFVDGENIYILGYDSFAMAILEHPFYKLVLGFPYTFYVVTYTIPDVPIQKFTFSIASPYQERIIGNRKLGHWIKSFIRHNNAVVAEFPSQGWPSENTFVINVLHPQFKMIEIKRIMPVFQGKSVP